MFDMQQNIQKILYFEEPDEEAHAESTQWKQTIQMSRLPKDICTIKFFEDPFTNSQ